MQAKFNDGSVIVAGRIAKDVEFKTVGEKSSRVCTASVIVGRKPNPDDPEKPLAVWANIKAWHDLASLLAAGRKGDSICVIGRLESREYEGKTYTDLVAEWLSVASVHAAASAPSCTCPTPTGGDQFADVPDDGTLPF